MHKSLTFGIKYSIIVLESNQSRLLWKGWKSQLNCYERWPVVYYWSSVVKPRKIKLLQENYIFIFLSDNRLSKYPSNWDLSFLDNMLYL